MPGYGPPFRRYSPQPAQSAPQGEISWNGDLEPPATLLSGGDRAPGGLPGLQNRWGVERSPAGSIPVRLRQSPRDPCFFYKGFWGLHHSTRARRFGSFTTLCPSGVRPRSEIHLVHPRSEGFLIGREEVSVTVSGHLYRGVVVDRAVSCVGRGEDGRVRVKVLWLLAGS